MYHLRYLAIILVALALLLAASRVFGQHRPSAATVRAAHPVHVAPAAHTYVAPTVHYGGYRPAYNYGYRPAYNYGYRPAYNYGYRGYYPWYSGSVYLGYTPYYYGTLYSPNITVYPEPSYSYYYMPPAVTPAPMPVPVAENVARVHVIVPPDAQVWFEGTPATLTGTDRQFVSPSLDPGKTYTYEVRAQWMENNRMVDQIRRVSVRANDTATVDFTVPAR